MDSLLPKLAEGGPLTGWVLFALSLLALIYLYKRVNDIQEARLSDLRQANDVTDSVKDVILPVVNSLNAIQTTLEVIKDRSKQ